MSSSGSIKLRYEKCLEYWGNAKVHVHQAVSQLAVLALRLLKLQRIHKLHR